MNRLRAIRQGIKGHSRLCKKHWQKLNGLKTAGRTHLPPVKESRSVARLIFSRGKNTHKNTKLSNKEPKKEVSAALVLFNLLALLCPVLFPLKEIKYCAVIKVQ